ncbi:hypothetical protein KID03_08285 [bacterium]|uniref:Uncharacterized protein n=1 Tax=Candidatus Scatenecus faecavium TaxID=2840915 RepID=A0A9D1FXT7_9BACT|nr:hypothetical protein [bacterium]HIS83898.1 hypothetical protein [Candidatus Scatenecus faecavium]
MLKPAFGAVSMLLALLILGVIAAMMLPMLKATSGADVSGTSLKQESVEQKADEMIKEIELRKQQTMDYYNNSHQ